MSIAIKRTLSFAGVLRSIKSALHTIQKASSSSRNCDNLSCISIAYFPIVSHYINEAHFQDRANFQFRSATSPTDKNLTSPTLQTTIIPLTYLKKFCLQNFMKNFNIWHHHRLAKIDMITKIIVGHIHCSSYTSSPMQSAQEPEAGTVQSSAKTALVIV